MLFSSLILIIVAQELVLKELVKEERDEVRIFYLKIAVSNNLERTVLYMLSVKILIMKGSFL